MKIDHQTHQFLLGEKFDDLYSYDLSAQRFPERDRISTIVDICSDKRVIHIGCTDHIGLIDRKIQEGRWLHGRLKEVVSKLKGVDINAEAVEYVRELGHTECFRADVLEDQIVNDDEEIYDYILFGEIVEHVDNPVAFLSRIHERLKGKVNKIIVTVPNVYNHREIRNIKRCVERVNSDHRYWFTPYTISKVMYQAGYSDVQLNFANLVTSGKTSLVLRKAQKVLCIPRAYPFTHFGTMVCEAKF